MVFGKTEAKYFCVEVWTEEIRLKLQRKIVVLARLISGIAQRWRPLPCAQVSAERRERGTQRQRAEVQRFMAHGAAADQAVYVDTDAKDGRRGLVEDVIVPGDAGRDVAAEHGAE
jgi:hypothetical protein